MTQQHHQRFFSNPKEILQASDPHQELIASLERINTHNPPVHTCSTGWTFHGFYTGPTSIAYLFHRLSELYPDLEFKQQPLREWCQEYLNLSSHTNNSPPSPNNCGIANETLVHLALTAVSQQEAGLVKQLCLFGPSINSTQDDGSNEWMYGRAGYLYLLRLCRPVVRDKSHSSTASLLETTIESTVHRICKVPQPWTWHGKRYLGAAHGTIGIICQVILSKPSVAPSFENIISNLLDKQFESGNFPSSLPAGNDRLVQFCHGSPGILLSLRSLQPLFPRLQSKIQEAIEKAQGDIWERGVLRKAPSLCHGLASNALALDDDQQFEVFLSCLCSTSMEKLGWMKVKGRGDEFASLYTGEAGRAWTWAIADRRLPRTCIGYNDL
ncbi:uncharacterized protein JN550_002309 [Neoarthrinium moseri]|uniref:uncharacterized protein n=1 Tax=Neoarthrinium moseri TaxID=1658444 RepID=UPI001FDBDE28|nr:uncharacterized protein JN550_002309 [Neoarthrinium moseri]KAI1874880.1 hypothetical protein JN550_002309 [Neoarthrinium moseri]